MSWTKFEQLPEGWKFDKTCGSPLSGYAFATNGRSVLNGGQRALVAVQLKRQEPTIYPEIKPPEVKKREPMSVETRRVMNELARAKFQEQLLKELSFDLMVCKIEGWDTAEYVANLHKLIDGLHESINPAQGNLFAHHAANRSHRA
jgi:hypothetical protein